MTDHRVNTNFSDMAQWDMTRYVTWLTNTNIEKKIMIVIKVQLSLKPENFKNFWKYGWVMFSDSLQFTCNLQTNPEDSNLLGKYIYIYKMVRRERERKKLSKRIRECSRKVGSGLLMISKYTLLPVNRSGEGWVFLFKVWPEGQLVLIVAVAAATMSISISEQTKPISLPSAGTFSI